MPNCCHVAAFHLEAIGATSKASFPHHLKTLLEHPNWSKLVAVGVQIGGNFSRLKRLGVEVMRWIELRQLAARHDSKQKEDVMTLAALSCHYLGKKLTSPAKVTHMIIRPPPCQTI